MGLPEVDPAVGIAALRDVARRGASIAATRANRAMINEECGKRAENIRGTSRLSPVSQAGLAVLNPQEQGR